MKFGKKSKGFTFVEILGVLIIIAILLSISVVSFRHSQAKARDVVRKSDLQMIADALISYGNDHGHFPSSIYDNGQALTISQALNTITECGNYSQEDLSYHADQKCLPYISGLSTELGGSDRGGGGGGVGTTISLESLKAAGENNKEIEDLLESVASIFVIAEKNTPLETEGLNNPYENMNYSIVTQGMCVSLLEKYLVKEGYISNIPQDPSGESVNLQTNICAEPGNFQGGVNANDTDRSIQGSDCYANTNFGCTQICKEGYVYVSDGEHFALIAHMESENGGNYDTTATTACEKPLSCEVAGKCKNTPGKSPWTNTEQLPCDITDEFTNSFNCIQENGVVEYNTGEYYFYIY